MQRGLFLRTIPPPPLNDVACCSKYGGVSACSMQDFCSKKKSGNNREHDIYRE